MTGVHTVKYLDFGDGRHKARCACGWSSTDQRSLKEAGDEVRKHQENIEVIKAHLGNRNPSLASQAEYYRAKSLEDPDEKNREMWKILASGLEWRLGLNAPPSKQEELPLGEEFLVDQKKGKR